MESRGSIAFQAGLKAGRLGTAPSLNPYPGTESARLRTLDELLDHCSWLAGWRSAQQELLRAAHREPFPTARREAVVLAHPEISATQLEQLCQRCGLERIPVGAGVFRLVAAKTRKPVVALRTQTSGPEAA